MAHLHVRTCRCTPTMTCVICIAAWSLIIYQIWLQSADPSLSYSSAANFDTLHAARDAVTAQMDGCWFHSRQKGCGYPSKSVCQLDPWLQRYKLVKSVTGSGRVGPCRVEPGRSYTQFCALFTKELRFALRS